MKAAGHVEWARAVIEHPELGLDGAWPRAAALLARQGLEVALDDYWERHFPPMRDTSRRTQLLCLGQYVGSPELARRVRSAWMALTRACHHHPYELAPVADELRSWFEHVDVLIDQLTEETVPAG
jgi:hypothetical protein